MTTEQRRHPAFIVILVPILTIWLILGLPGLTTAHDGATGIVKERHDAMKSLGQVMKSWKAILDGAQPPDQATLKVISNQLAAGAGHGLLALFPKDGSGHKTKALPIIWTEWDKFERLALVLEARARSLPKARLDIIEFRSEFKAVGQICRECHDRFRKR